VTLACRPQLGEREIVRTLNALLTDWPGILEPIEPGRYLLDLPTDRRNKLLQSMDECVIDISRPQPDRVHVALRGLFVLPGLTVLGFGVIALVIVPHLAPRFPWPITIPFLVLALARYIAMVRTCRHHLDLLLESLSLQDIKS
jgi:hypothetical protein